MMENKILSTDSRQAVHQPHSNRLQRGQQAGRRTDRLGQPELGQAGKPTATALLQPDQSRLQQEDNH